MFLVYISPKAKKRCSPTLSKKIKIFKINCKINYNVKSSLVVSIYIRDFILKLSEKTKKNRKAMKEDPFRWTEDVAQEVRQLKAEVQTLPPLALVYSKPFIHSIDAPSDTWASVQLKKENKEEKNMCIHQWPIQEACAKLLAHRKRNMGYGKRSPKTSH
ncbi:hypothetical protein AMTRI_Chr06g171890 [Amborella trichopoda]